MRQVNASAADVQLPEGGKKIFTEGIQRRLFKHYVNKKPNPLKTKLTIAYNFQRWGARVAQW